MMTFKADHADGDRFARHPQVSFAGTAPTRSSPRSIPIRALSPRLLAISDRRLSPTPSSQIKRNSMMRNSESRRRGTNPRQSSIPERSLLDDLSVVIVGNKVLPVSPSFAEEDPAITAFSDRASAPEPTEQRPCADSTGQRKADSQSNSDDTRAGLDTHAARSPCGDTRHSFGFSPKARSTADKR